MRARWATLAAAMAAMVTSCELSPRLYLTVRTEQGSMVRRVLVRVYSPVGGDAALTDGVVERAIDPEHPLEMRVLGRVGGERVRLTVDGLDEGETLIHQEWVTSMPSEGGAYLQIVLWNNCLGRPCGAGTTCASSGACVPNTVAELPTSPADASLGYCADGAASGCRVVADASVADAGVADATSDRAMGFDARDEDVPGPIDRPTVDVRDTGMDVPRDLGLDAPRDVSADRGNDATTDTASDAGVDGGRCPGRSPTMVPGWTNCGGGWCPTLCGGAGSCVHAERLVQGRDHGCALRSDRGVSCWGDHEVGRLGDGVVDGGVTAVPVGVVRAVTGMPLSSVVAMAAGNNGTCAVDQAGGLFCWGDFNADPLGNENQPGYAATVARRMLRGDAGAAANLFEGAATHVALTCGVVRGGGVRCSSWVRFLADGTTEVIPRVADFPLTDVARIDGAALTGVRELGVGLYHACSRLADGSVWCWGTNGFGQLGAPLVGADGGGVGASERARQIPGLTGVTSLGVGDFFSCALAGGDVRCWGSATLGRVGSSIGLVECAEGNECAPVPVSVEGLAELSEAYASPVVQVAAGGEQACARLANGRVWCWGLNDQGQLGLPTTGAGRVESRAGVQGAAVFEGADDVVTGGEGGASGRSWTCARRASDCTWWCWGRVPGESAPPAEPWRPRVLRWAP